MDLLLLADPSKEKISDYLNTGVLFVGKIAEEVISVAVIEEKEKNFEIMNIAVDPKHQGRGYGKQMLFHLIQFAEKLNAQEVYLGTGNSSLSQLAFYQKMGFRITKVISDYFAGYNPPIYENGIRCIDMLILTYRNSNANNTTILTAEAAPHP